MTFIQVVCAAVGGLSALGWVAYTLYERYKAAPTDKTYLYVFKPDEKHLEWLAKYNDALKAAPDNFVLNQVMLGKSIAEALEAYSKLEKSSG